MEKKFYENVSRVTSENLRVRNSLVLPSTKESRDVQNLCSSYTSVVLPRTSKLCCCRYSLAFSLLKRLHKIFFHC